MNPAAPLLWIIHDSKPGHLNQSLGLAEALKRRLPALHWQLVPALSCWQIIPFLRRQQPRPTLIVAAGHRTHFSLLAISKYLHIPSIVLMKPSLPTAWFDLCLIPQHDHPQPRDNIVLTQGALNRIRPGSKKSNTGLILIGGPSRHFGWDDDALLQQIRTLLQRDRRQWILTTSRRTPPSTLKKLQALDTITVFPASDTGPDWLPQQLAMTERCWITQDSVSMIYEALTAQCRVDLLTLPVRSTGKLAAAIDALCAANLIATDHPIPLAEADRCARIIHQRFLS